MSEKIYYGDLDIIDTRTNTVRQFKNIVYKESQTISEIRDKEIKKIPQKEIRFYKIEYHRHTAKVLGYSNI